MSARGLPHLLPPLPPQQTPRSRGFCGRAHRRYASVCTPIILSIARISNPPAQAAVMLPCKESASALPAYVQRPRHQREFCNAPPRRADHENPRATVVSQRRRPLGGDLRFCQPCRGLVCHLARRCELSLEPRARRRRLSAQSRLQEPEGSAGASRETGRERPTTAHTAGLRKYSAALPVRKLCALRASSQPPLPRAP